MSSTIRPAWAEIRLDHLAHNLRVLRREAGCGAIYGVVKADAYGHGASIVARALERGGIDGFAVALVEEAVVLRQAGVTRPILVLGGCFRGAWPELLEARLTPVLQDPGQIEAFGHYLRTHSRGPVEVHLELDTGMARFGVRPADLQPALTAFRAFPELRLDGLMTHFASAEVSDGTTTTEQLRLFRQLTAQVFRAGERPRQLHASNSAAVLSRVAPDLNLVRPGLALYGISPFPDETTTDLRPVMRIRSEVVALRTVAVGEPSGYGSTWRATRPSRLATIALGYADGVPRALSNHGEFLVGNRRAAIVGVVSMDAVVVDVTDLPAVDIGTETVFFGPPEGTIDISPWSVTDVARQGKTIPWEILTGIGPRLPRVARE